MFSRHFNHHPSMPAFASRAGAGGAAPEEAVGALDHRLRSPDGDVLVEIKRTSTLRDVRGMLLALAYALHEDDGRRSVEGSVQPPATAVLVLLDSKVQTSTLARELDQFRVVSSSRLGARIHAVTARADGEFDPASLPSELAQQAAKFIAQLIRKELGAVVRPARVTKQTVKATMLESLVSGSAGDQPKSMVELQRASGASYPTVAGALKELSARRALDESGVSLVAPDPEVWRSIATGFAGERRVRRYIDPTGQAMRAEKLLALLGRQRHQRAQSSQGPVPGLALAVGGVLGAKMLYPGLDMTGSTRLDLCVFDGDDSFVAQLDPGLVPTDDPLAKPVLVLHFTRDVRPLSRRTPNADPTGDNESLSRIDPASAVDCYADLLELGYAREARDFAIAMTNRSDR